ncbi:MAG: hypothetical protein AAB676_04590 [Verrucomicrobiota bacterium]
MSESIIKDRLNDLKPGTIPDRWWWLQSRNEWDKFQTDPYAQGYELLRRLPELHGFPTGSILGPHLSPLPPERDPMHRPWPTLSRNVKERFKFHYVKLLGDLGFPVGGEVFVATKFIIFNCLWPGKRSVAFVKAKLECPAPLIVGSDGFGLRQRNPTAKTPQPHDQYIRSKRRFATWKPIEEDKPEWIYLPMPDKVIDPMGEERTLNDNDILTAFETFIRKPPKDFVAYRARLQRQRGRLGQLNGLLAPAHPLQEEILQPFPNLHYYWSVTQSEYATDLLFKDERELARVDRAFVLHGRCTFHSPDVLRFLGHRVPVTTGRVDARFQGEVRTDVLDRHEGVCLKHRAGFNGQKACDKFWNLLRVENTLNRPEAFTVSRAEPAPAAPASLPPSPRARTTAPPQSLPPNPPARVTGRVPEVKPRRAWQPLRRSVTDLPRRAEVSRAANRRYLDARASTQVGPPLGQAAAPLGRPVTHQGHRYRALHPLNSSDGALLRALSRGEWTIAGLRNRDLQRLL